MKWTFTSGGKHQIWHIRVLRYAESNKIGRQAVKLTKPFHFSGCLNETIEKAFVATG